MATDANIPTRYPKRLIEVDLPIRRISEHARREKSIRHGHISTLHIWWARRPLAACRAVICAALWPDPADPDCPAQFREKATEKMLAWTTHERQALLSPDSRPRFERARRKPERLQDPEELRGALLDFIADFANWDNATISDYLETSRALTQAAHESLGGGGDTKPLVVDPFAGGGSMPMEALRVGADAFASDLNPVPIVLNRVALEYIPRYGEKLAEEVKKWGAWINEQAAKELSEFYPADKNGGKPIAYIWCRTVISEAPGAKGAPIEVPLISSLWLSKKPHRGRALRWVRDDNGNIRCKKVKKVFQNGQNLEVKQPLLEVFEPKKANEVEEGTVRRGSVTCPVTGFTSQVDQVREQLLKRGGGTRDARLVCVVTTREEEKGRHYRVPSKEDFAAYDKAVKKIERLQATSKSPLSLIPGEKISLNELRRISVPIYGMASWGDLFSQRQLLVLVSLARLIGEAGTLCRKEHPGDNIWEAVQAILALNLGKSADYGSALATWSSPASQETVRNTFGRQAIPMVWDFAEANPFAASSGGWAHSLGFIDKLVQEISASKLARATVEQASATSHPLPDDAADCIATDPPYYDAVPYAHLSDFFCVWLRRSLPKSLAQMFSEEGAPKAAEIVVDRPHQLSNSRKDVAFYERELTKAFGDARRVLRPEGIATIVFASKTTASWEAILKAVIDAGLIITGSWPIDTEREGRMASIGQARLASSVHLVCRPRENPDGSVRSDEVGDWRDVLQALPVRIHEWMPRLAKEGVVGADAIFACLGPALEIFSRYSRVEKGSGDPVSLKEYLEHVWAAVAKEALTMIFAGADATGFEEDSRLTAMWLWTLKTGNGNGGEAEGNADDEDEENGKGSKVKGFSLEYDAARKIAQGLGAHLEELQSLVEVAGENARLLPVAERARYLFGKDEGKATPVKRKKDAQLDLFKPAQATAEEESGFGETKIEKVGETVLDRIHQSMILFAAGRSGALRRFITDDGAGKDPRFWTLAQALSALYPGHTEEKRWVDGLLARKKALGF